MSDEKFDFAKCFEHQSPSRYPTLPNPDIKISCGPSRHELDKRIAALENAMENIQSQLTRLDNKWLNNYGAE